MAVPNTSKRAANAAILKELDNAGDNGLHLHELVSLLGFTEGNQILLRLRELKSQGEIIQLAGEKWKLQEEMAKTINKSDTNVYFPGSPKFTSYKNSLQMYCQKNYLGMPSYTNRKAESGFFSTVRFGTVEVKSTAPMPATKEAEQRVAYDALIGLGFGEGGTFKTIQTRKRPSSKSAEEEPPTKVANVSYKSKLQELAQKNKLPMPVYRTWAQGSGFMASITFNRLEYTTVKPVAKKKDAEQHAAHIALYKCRQISTPPDENEGTELTNVAQDTARDTTQDSTQGAVQDTAEGATSSVSGDLSEGTVAGNNPQIPYAHKKSFKNAIQEYCQKKRICLPSYNTEVILSGGFQTTLTVDSKTYQGEQQQAKKAAEQDAARVALVDLGLLAS